MYACLNVRLYKPDYSGKSDDVARYMRISLFLRVLGFIISLIWAVITWFLLLWKTNSDGSPNVAQFFTNWIWTVNLIFYTLDIISYLDSDGSIFFNIISMIFPILHGTNWVVFLVVFLILDENPNLILQEGANHPLGLVFIGDRFYHVLPLVVMLLYMVFRRYMIGQVVHFWLAQLPKSYNIFWMVWVLLSPFLLILVYFGLYNAIQIYSLTVSIWLLALFIIIVVLVANGIFIFLFKDGSSSIVIKS